MYRRFGAILVAFITCLPAGADAQATDVTGGAPQWSAASAVDGQFAGPPPPPRPPKPPVPPTPPKKSAWALGRSEATDTVTRTFRLSTGGALDIQSVSGDIAISAGKGDSLRVEAVKRARGRTDEDARAQLALLHVDIAEQGGRVTIAERREPDAKGAYVTFTVVLPAGARVDVQTVSGDVSVLGMSGPVAVKTVSGDVEASSGSNVSLRTVSGDVVMLGSRISDTLDLSTVSGDIRARDVSVPNIVVGTVSGDVYWTGAMTRAQVKTVSGDVNLATDVARGGSLAVTAHSGDVTVALSGRTGFVLDAKTFSGSLSSDLPLSSSTSRERDDHRLHGTFGDGSATITVTTFSGDLSLTKSRQ